MTGRNREYPLDLYKLGLGLFVFLSPWLFSLSYSPARIDSAISGAVVMALSSAALIAFSDWEEWATLAVGAWLVAAPWILAFPHAAAMKIHIGVGLVVTYLAGLELWLAHYDNRGKSV
ncbi:MAG TPA: SPW repeat protein [Hyphomicrobiaceae bacterium]|nr:SPW repeat protein [Hyphomicrobiaceae bacterium]